MPFLLKEALKHLVLVVRQAVNRLGIAGVVRVSLGKKDPSTCQERVRPDDPGLAVEIAVVVASRAERPERAEALAGAFEATRKEVVDAFSPRRRMDLGASRQHAVEVEETCSDFGRKAKRTGARAGSGESMVQLKTFLVRDRVEQTIRHGPLLGESPFERRQLLARQSNTPAASTCGSDGVLSGKQREPPMCAELVECPRGRGAVRISLRRGRRRRACGPTRNTCDAPTRGRRQLALKRLL
jgi:hypothetical protein